MSMFSALTSAPTNAAMQYYNQIPAVLQQYLSPYINAGTDSLNTVAGQYKDLTTDPGAKFSDLTSGFEESPSYQYQYKQGENAANNAAAAGGGSGSSEHMEDSAKMASNLADQEYQQYAKNVMGLYGQGLQGETGLTELGAKTSGDMAQGLSSNLMNEGNMAAMSAMNKNKMLGGLLGDAGSTLGYLFGGEDGMNGEGGMNPNAGFATALSSLMSLL